jgi:hypothetical protein
MRHNRYDTFFSVTGMCPSTFQPANLNSIINILFSIILSELIFQVKISKNLTETISLEKLHRSGIMKVKRHKVSV